MLMVSPAPSALRRTPSSIVRGKRSVSQNKPVKKNAIAAMQHRPFQVVQSDGDKDEECKLFHEDPVASSNLS
ncbi:hypothetical protein ACVWXM_006989 [Bradyrhizobium sp. GM7.3]